MARTWHKWATAAIVLGWLGLICGRSILFHHFEPQFLTTGPNGPETPESVGLAYERVKIPSLNRTLDGYLVQGPSA
jgi:hypothetical protein